MAFNDRQFIAMPGYRKHNLTGSSGKQYQVVVKIYPVQVAGISPTHNVRSCKKVVLSSTHSQHFANCQPSNLAEHATHTPLHIVGHGDAPGPPGPPRCSARALRFVASGAVARELDAAALRRPWCRGAHGGTRGSWRSC